MEIIKRPEAKIRQACLDDVESLMIIKQELQLSTYASGQNSGIRDALETYFLKNDQQIKNRYQNEISDLSRIFLVAVDGGEPVGFCNADRPNRYISGLFVDPRHHGQGIGTELLYKTLKQLDAENNDVALSVVVNNSSAISFYSRHNFEVVGDADPLVIDDSHQLLCVRMVRPSSPVE